MVKDKGKKERQGGFAPTVQQINADILTQVCCSSLCNMFILSALSNKLKNFYGVSILSTVFDKNTDTVTVAISVILNYSFWYFAKFK